MPCLSPLPPRIQSADTLEREFTIRSEASETFQRGVLAGAGGHHFIMAVFT